MNQGINAYELNSFNDINKTNTEINANLFSNIDFGVLKTYLDDDNITDISYSNNGQVWLKSIDKGVYRVDNPGINNELMEKIAFQCANIMGKTFNMASPLLDSESSELRMNFIHDSIARNGIAAVFRKTPAKIRLKKEKIIEEKYITLGIHDFLIECVRGHCNIIVSGETGSGKTELVKYLASHTKENEKIITIEDTLELHLDTIFPQRDIVSMKTNNIASYSEVLVGCMRQNPKWILLSEVRSAEAVTAVRNSISSGHNILSTIHADKASSIPYRMYSLLESNIDVEQFMSTIYRYIQLGVHVRARYDKQSGKFMREVCEVCEFFVDHDNKPDFNVIYRKNVDGSEVINSPSNYLIDYLESQGINLKEKDFQNIKIDLPFQNEDISKSSLNNQTNVSVINQQSNLNFNNNDIEEFL
ncbi:MAG: CpaF family protein [Bacilli bacterium]|nr:CpaF family protein [Bacilli bacterium]